MPYKHNKNTIAYNNQYNAKNYDRVALMLPAGEKAALKAHAAAQGESLNGFIVRAIRETVERDKAEEAGD